jgi:WD40 repeat protein
MAGGHAARVRFSPDGKELWLAPAENLPAVRASGGVGEAIQIDVSSGRIVSTRLRNILWAVFSDDGQRVAGVAGSNAVVLADLRAGAEARTLERHARAISGMAFSADGERLASVSDDGTAWVWNLRLPNGSPTDLKLEGRGSALAFDGTGGLLGTLAWDG